MRSDPNPDFAPLGCPAEQLELFNRLTVLTVAEAIGLFMELEGRFAPSNSIKTEFKNLSANLGKRYLHEVTSLDVRYYREMRRSDEVKESTINREQSRINRLFNAFRAWKSTGRFGGYDFSNLRLPEENPCKGVKMGPEVPRNVVVAPEDFRRFLDYAHPEVRKICVLAVLTMLRRKDLQVLEKESFNQALSTVSGVQSKTQKPYLVPACQTVRVMFGSMESKYVLDFTNWRRRFDQAKRDSGIFFQLRDLRRTGATGLILEGTDLRTIQRLLGHSTLGMTERYLQPPEKVGTEAVRKLESKYTAKWADVEYEYAKN